MADKKLVEYIKKSVRKGSSITLAEKNLILAGHDPDEVEAAAKFARKQHFKRLGIILLSLVLLLATIGILVEVFKPTAPVPLPAMDLLENAIKNGDISACDQFSPAKRDICIKSINGDIVSNKDKVDPVKDYIANAVANNDPSACDAIDSVVQRTKCLMQFSTVASNTSEVDNTSEVILTPSQVENNIVIEASQTQDPTLCDSISSPSAKKRCLALSNQ